MSSVLIVLSADLLFLLPSVLICCVMLRSGWKLYDLSADKGEHFTTLEDIVDHILRRNGRGIADDRGVALMGRHWALMVSTTYLCVHVPACVSLVFIKRLALISTDWSGVTAAALIGCAVGAGVAVSADASIRNLHRSMAPQFDFAAAVRSWAEEEYDEDERQDVLRLVFKMSDLAGGVPIADGPPTPEAGADAVRAVLEHLDGMRAGGASWLFKLSDQEREIYNKILEGIGK